MEPEHIIDETATIQGADIEKVFDDCVEWLLKNRADITLMNKPILIQANHVRGTWFEPTTPDDWYKEISIRLEQLDDDVSIHLLMDFSEMGSSTNVRKVKSYWPLIVEKLWRHIGVDISRELLLDLYPISVLEFTLNDFKKELIMTYILLISPLFPVLLVNNLIVAQIGMLPILGYIVMIALLLMWLRRSKYFQVRRLLLELYPYR